MLQYLISFNRFAMTLEAVFSYLQIFISSLYLLSRKRATLYRLTQAVFFYTFLCMTFYQLHFDKNI